MRRSSLAFLFGTPDRSDDRPRYAEPIIFSGSHRMISGKIEQRIKTNMMIRMNGIFRYLIENLLCPVYPMHPDYLVCIYFFSVPSSLWSW